MQKPYAESCDQNKDPIFAVIKSYLIERSSVLEIGSGTGQHAIYFAEKLPHLTWYTSDREQYHNGIIQWLDEAKLTNARKPFLLDVSRSSWPETTVDAVFSANTSHIMHWHDVQATFSGVGKILNDDGIFLLYGPFNFAGKYTSESNQQFDYRLKSRDPMSGIRNFEDLDQLANQAGLQFQKVFDMPCNNKILSWQKTNR